MFCKKCGAQIADGQLFCGSCGAAVFKNENEAQGQPVQQNPVNEAAQRPYAPQNNAFAPKRAPQKSKKPVIIAIVAAIVVLAVIAICCIPMLKRAFMSEQAVMASYDRDSIEDGLETLSSSFKTGRNNKYSGNVEINFSDYLAAQLGKYIGNISSADISFDAVNDEEQYGFRLNLSLSDTDIISVDVTLDVENNKAYISVPGLIDGALELDLGEFMPEDGKASVSSIVNNASSLELSNAVIKEALAVIDAAYKAAGDAAKAQDALVIDGVSQNCTVYTLSINEETAAKVVVSALQQLKKSQNIKNFVGNLVENYYEGLTKEEIISEIDVFCDSGIESLTEEGLVFGDEEAIVYNMYVSDDEVIGRSFEVNGVKILAAAVKNGRDKAFEYSIHQEFEGSVKFAGKGTEDKDGFTGEAVLSVYEEDMVYFEYDKFILDDDKISGSVEISLGDGVSELDLYNQKLSVLATVGLKLDFDVKDEAGKVTVGLSLMNFDLGEIVIEGTPGSDYVPAIPEKISFSDPQAFGKAIDIFALFTRLSQAGFDLSGLMSGMLG